MTAQAHKDPQFFDRNRETVTTSRGLCELPIFYQEASLLTAIWRVDPEAARPLVPVDFEPWRVLGKALAMMCVFEYRRTSIGPYNELGLGILVRRKGSRPSLLRALGDLRKEEDQGLFVTNLPVTTEEARAAGAEIWGYPKYVRAIDTRFSPDRVRAELAGELCVTMDRGRSVRTRGVPIVTYSVSAERRLLRTVIDVDNDVGWAAPSSVDLTIVGDGPTSRNARSLGLDRRKPAFVFCTDGMRSVLPRGKDMGTATGGSAKPNGSLGKSAVAGTPH